MKTPSKNTMLPWEVDPYESPSAVRNIFTPSKKTAIGPTPQKDGQVLGIFDLLEESNTPSKKNSASGANLQALLHSTPRKPTNDIHATPRHTRTPASAGKRFMLDKFTTPSKNPHPNGQGGKTPSSVSKLYFATPSFLRRDSQRPQMPTVNENDEDLELSPQPLRLPRKPLVRGLSSMLAGLRKMEEEAADEDLEALHEMENELAAVGRDPPSKAPIPTPQETVQVEEASQPRLPLGGFDDEALLDSEPDELQNPTLGRDGLPIKIYKKKGQKRTTRRVTLKPSRAKPVSAPRTTDEEEEGASDDEFTTAAAADDSTIPETQQAGDDDDTTAAAFEDARNFDSDSQSEYTASEGGTRYRRPNQGRRGSAKEGKIRTVARKVNAVAHQNFKRLKLRNSGAKGGPAHNSRFRRRK